MFISDRNSVLIGSANLTEGGLYRNHEVGVIINYRENKHAADEVAHAIQLNGGESLTRQFDVSVQIEVETENKKLKKDNNYDL